MTTGVAGAVIEFTPEEFEQAVFWGGRRHADALRAGLPDKNGHAGDGLELHVTGCAGEMAVSSAMGIYWRPTTMTFHGAADIQPGIEVRTRRQDHYDLIVRNDDNPRRAFVLVIRQSETRYRVVGWIKGQDAMRPEWLQTHGNRPAAYFVPQSALRPISELAAAVHGHLVRSAA